MLSVGKILKAHGVRGELKAECYTDTPTCLVRVKKLFIEGKEFSVVKARVQGDFLLIKMAGVDDMDTAETLRGKELFANKEDMPPLSDGRFYIEDVLGSQVYIDEEKLGKLIDILQYGSADVYVIKTRAGKNVLFPYVGDVVKEMDPVEKRVVLDRKEFEKVAVYED